VPYYFNDSGWSNVLLLSVVVTLAGFGGLRCATTPVSERYDPSEIPYDTLYASEDVDTPPTLKGGMERLVEEMEYPKQAVREGVGGKVWIGFIVQPDGSVSHVQVVKHNHPVLEREARRVIRQARFDPGFKSETKVPVKMVIPLTFKTKTPLRTRKSNSLQ
jgi:protein TonB